MTELLDGVPVRILDRSLRATTVGMVTLVTLVAFEAMAVATALPTAVRDLRGLAYYGWPFTAFLVANVIGMVAAGALADRYGPGRPLVIGLAVFGGGLLLAGVAPVMAVFVLGRAVQGLGGGVQIVALYVLIGAAYPQSLRPRAFAALSASWVLPALVGPVLAGAAVQRLSWRLVFLGLVPFVLAGGLLLASALRRIPPRSAPAPAAAGARRWPAALAAGVGIAALQAAGQRPGWPALLVAVPGLALLAFALRRLLPAGTVLIRVGVPAVVAFRGALAGSLFAVESLVPLTLALVHGYRPIAAGAPLMSSAVCWSAASWWQGRRPELPGPALVRAGLALIGAAALVMAVVARPAAPGWLAYPGWALAGTGAGLAWSRLSVLLLALTPPAQHGVNSAALQIADAVGSALCIGAAGALVAAAERGALPLPAALGTVDVAMAGLAVAAAALAVRARAPVPAAA